jgi:hypothetical protein
VQEGGPGSSLGLGWFVAGQQPGGAGSGGMPGVADRRVVVDVLDDSLLTGPCRPPDVGLGVGVVEQ